MAERITTENGYIVAPSGLLAPPTYRQSKSQVLQFEQLFAPDVGYVDSDVALPRDADTLIVKWPKKGGIISERILAAIADGRIRNSGISPFPFGQISGILGQQMAQASNSSIKVTGRTSPRRRAVAAISRMNDSPVGYVEAIQQILYSYRTYNRGQPIMTAPFTYPISQWDGLGLTLIPIDEKKRIYYVEVDSAKNRSPVPFLPDPLACVPTGNNRYPYWFQTYADDEQRRPIWVLMHNSQIVPCYAGSSAEPGIGTSSVYKCLSFLGEHLLAVEEMTEKLLNQPPAMLGISGIDETARDVKDKVGADLKETKAKGFRVDTGYTVFTSRNKIDFELLHWRQPTGEEWGRRKERYEDELALFFDEPLNAVATRGGIGYGVQSETVSQNTADAGVSAVLHYIGNVFGVMFPTVSVRIIRANDRAVAGKVATLSQFAQSMSTLIGLGVATPDEARAYMQQNIIELPEVEGKSTSSATADDDQGSGEDDGGDSDDSGDVEDTNED